MMFFKGCFRWALVRRMFYSRFAFSLATMFPLNTLRDSKRPSDFLPDILSK